MQEHKVVLMLERGATHSTDEAGVSLRRLRCLKRLEERRLSWVSKIKRLCSVEDGSEQKPFSFRGQKALRLPALCSTLVTLRQRARSRPKLQQCATCEAFRRNHSQLFVFLKWTNWMGSLLEPICFFSLFSLGQQRAEPAQCLFYKRACHCVGIWNTLQIR